MQDERVGAAQGNIGASDGPNVVRRGDRHAQQVVVALGGTNTLILHWDGTTWSLVGSPNVALYNQLRAVSAESAQNVWAVGYYYVPQRGQQTLIEHWDGTAWSVVPSPNVGVHDNLLEG